MPSDETGTATPTPEEKKKPNMVTHYVCWIALCAALGVFVGWRLGGIWVARATWEMTAEDWLTTRPEGKLNLLQQLLGNPIGGGVAGTLLGVVAAKLTSLRKR